MDYNNYERVFKNKFNAQPILVRSPGRINIIGEHTDYNGGFVMPAAVDKEMVLAVAPNHTDVVRVFALDLDEEVSFSISKVSEVTVEWAKYIAGVMDQFQKMSLPVAGFDCVFGGNIPLGAGMSSSAALECGIGFAMSEMFDLKVPPMELALAGQRAENEFVGVNCGIMDQFANVFSKKDQVIKLDCRNLSYEYAPADLNGCELVLFDTQVKHALGSSEYNVRRSECEEGVALMAQHYPNVSLLRDCTMEMLEAVSGLMASSVRARCEYIITEIERVRQASKALSAGDVKYLGELMYATHKGLSTLYEVSCDELDLLVDLTQSMPGVLGARMMGGGFGGCTINLIDQDQTSDVINQVKNGYKNQFNKAPEVYKVKISQGTGKVK
ncbi:galactokinase [Fulvivirga sp. M361]|uniref:galactokinase n=1 Tax=Fulvivirga sp. M361 TaxID=2594266 RepID=UPI00117AF14C|nr:galactokinase [Fulvivirga sp. M361]TRX51300.1 galactokinase [Fulvivirga sp. M361]